jgi:hypothetical protein
VRPPSNSSVTYVWLGLLSRTGFGTSRAQETVTERYGWVR